MRTRTDRFDPASYWDRRYRDGRTSGAGSEGDAAKRKATEINRIIHDHDIESVIDWGCGDGAVLRWLIYDVDYTGVEISNVLLDRLRLSDHPGIATRRFMHVNDVKPGPRADLALSLDVLFHLPDDRDFVTHLHQVFGSARRLVLVHATDHDGGRTARHVRWRRWTPSIPRGWTVTRRPDDPTAEAFYVVERTGGVIPKPEARAGW